MTDSLVAGGPRPPRVGVVVLNWRNHAASARCLRSLASATWPNLRVVLVDNASGDGSLERLRDEFEHRGVICLANPENLGFAAGCNPGIVRALEDGCDYILLLNNDCVVHAPGFLEPAVALAQGDPTIGIVGGKILFWPHSSMIWSTGGFIGWWGAERHIGHGAIDCGQYDRVTERSFISGALMLVRRAVIERIGLLPEAYFFGKEEWEYSTRARRSGFRLMYHPAFSVCHEASNSHEWTDPTYVYNGTLSRILYQRRNRSRFAYHAWRTAFAAYLRWGLAARHAFARDTFLRGVPLAVIRKAMLEGLRDSEGLDRVTRATLDAFRARHPEWMRGPAASSAVAQESKPIATHSR